MPEPTQIDAAAAPAPDWDAVQTEVVCPLCEYNLRGLIEPRCPECGHQFEWTELLNRASWHHPWLFEHQNIRRGKAFVRTLANSLLPRRFWASVRAIHPLDLRRLIGYWLLSMIVILISAMPLLLMPVWQRYVAIAEEDRRFDQVAADPVQRTYMIQRFGSLQAARARYGPLHPPFATVLLQALRDQWWQRRSVLPSILITISWPWLTFASLMIYRISMRQARINRTHVLRCVIYSADAGLALSPLVILAAMLFDPYRYRYPSFGIIEVIHPFILFVGGALLLISTYRLSIAYTRYLRFPHAIYAVVASQVIVGLVLLKILFVLNGH